MLVSQSFLAEHISRWKPSTPNGRISQALGPAFVSAQRPKTGVCGKQALNLPRAAERESLQHRGTHKLARWLIVEESGGPDQLPNVPPVVSCKAKSRPKQLSPLSCERKSWHVPLPERHTPSGREREMYLNPPPGVVDTETTKDQLALKPPIWMRKSKE
jgi:hypothetical protein